MTLTHRITISLWTLAAALALAALALTVTEDISEQAIRKTRDIFTGRGMTIDENGIPMVSYGGSAGGVREPQRNPITISHAGLRYSGQLEAGDATAEQPFRNCADWLVDNTIPHGDWATLEYLFPYPRYGMRRPGAPEWHRGVRWKCWP